MMRIMGIDAGSVSVKVIVLDAAGSVQQRYYRAQRAPCTGDLRS
jgi:activator of 2-hydroxyglutaryl-CoA dehydratase